MTLRAAVATALPMLMLMLCVSSAQAAEPAAKSKADQLYETAHDHRKAGRFLEAAKAFDKAHAIEPSVVLLYNAGRMYDAAGELESARGRYRRFLAEETSPGDRRQKVVALLATIDKKLADQEARKAASIAAAAEAKRSAALRKAALEKQRLADLRLRRRDQAEVLTNSGFATLALGCAGVLAGVGLGVRAETLAASVRNLQPNASGVIDAVTEVEAEQRAQESEALALGAIVAASVGAAMVLTGGLLVMAADDTEEDAGGEVEVSFSPLRGGGALLQGRFSF